MGGFDVSRLWIDRGRLFTSQIKFSVTRLKKATLGGDKPDFFVCLGEKVGKHKQNMI